MNRAMIIINGQADRDKAARWAQGVPVGSRIEFKETKRSLPQNDRFWAMLTDIAAHMKKLGRDHTTDQWKVIFMAAFGHEVKFLPTLDQKSFIPLGHSSSDLSVKEMTDMIEFMLAWGAENGVIFNDNDSSSNSATPSTAPKDDLPDTDETQNSSADDGGDAVCSSSAPPSSNEQGDLPSELRQHLIDFARKASKTVADEDLSDEAKGNAIEDMIANYRDVVEEKHWSKLSSVKVAMQAVFAGKRTIEQARDFLARDLLDCDVAEIGGAA